jgi:hypothetical protein
MPWAGFLVRDELPNRRWIEAETQLLRGHREVVDDPDRADYFGN